jgi:hypothetical protein
MITVSKALFGRKKVGERRALFRVRGIFFFFFFLGGGCEKEIEKDAVGTKQDENYSVHWSWI